MKILLILPRDNTYYYKGSFLKSVSYAPLTLTTLAAMIPYELNAYVKIVDEGVQKVNYDEHFDLVGITACASSAPRAYELCDFFKKKGTYTVLGGAHPTLMPIEALKHADSVVVGTANKSWPELLFDYYNKKKMKKIYKNDKEKYIKYPVAKRELQKRQLYLKTPTVIASMGCGNSCEFCSINNLWGSYYKRDIDEVIDEIKRLDSKTILFLDPNLTYDNEYAKKLFSKLIPLKIKWAGLAGMDFVKDRELLDLVIKSGCEGILMGFESFSSESLKCTKKSKNNIKDYNYIVTTLKRAEISILGTFVLGLDGDNEESIINTVNQIDDLNLDAVRYSVLTPFPGTPLFDRYKKEDRIITENWYYYDQEHVVFYPKNISPIRLQELLHLIWKKSYSWKRIIKRVKNTKKRSLMLLGVNIGFKYYASKLKKIDNNQLQDLL